MSRMPNCAWLAGGCLSRWMRAHLLTELLAYSLNHKNELPSIGPREFWSNHPGYCLRETTSRMDSNSVIGLMVTQVRKHGVKL